MFQVLYFWKRVSPAQTGFLVKHFCDDNDKRVGQPKSLGWIELSFFKQYLCFNLVSPFRPVINYIRLSRTLEPRSRTVSYKLGHFD